MLFCQGNVRKFWTDSYVATLDVLPWLNLGTLRFFWKGIERHKVGDGFGYGENAGAAPDKKYSIDVFSSRV